MRRYILKTILFILPIILIGILIEVLIRNIPNDYNYKKEYLDKNSDNIEVLFLGTSHAYYGVNPNLIKAKSFNASHISQSIDYDYEIIKKYKENWKSLKTIAIPIDYSTLFSNLSKSKESWRVKNYQIYYDINNINFLSNNSELLTVKFNLNLKRVYSYYLKNITEITCSNLGYANIIDKHPKNKNFTYLTQTGKKAAKRHTKITSPDFLPQYKNNTKILKNIISFAHKNNIKIILYTSPAYKTYFNKLDKKQLNLTINSIQNLIANYTHCYYYNFIEDSNFTANDFRDADHLNDFGAQKLSLKLNECINEIKHH